MLFSFLPFSLADPKGSLEKRKLGKKVQLILLKASLHPFLSRNELADGSLSWSNWPLPLPVFAILCQQFFCTRASSGLLAINLLSACPLIPLALSLLQVNGPWEFVSPYPDIDRWQWSDPSDPFRLVKSLSCSEANGECAAASHPGLFNPSGWALTHLPQSSL